MVNEMAVTVLGAGQMTLAITLSVSFVENGLPLTVAVAVNTYVPGVTPCNQNEDCPNIPTFVENVGLIGTVGPETCDQDMPDTLPLVRIVDQI